MKTPFKVLMVLSLLSHGFLTSTPVKTAVEPYNTGIVPPHMLDKAPQPSDVQTNLRKNLNNKLATDLETPAPLTSSKKEKSKKVPKRKKRKIFRKRSAARKKRKIARGKYKKASTKQTTQKQKQAPAK